MSNNPTPEPAGMTQYVSATSNATQQEQSPATPEPPRHFKIHVDIHGVSYLCDTTTGDRFKLSEDELDPGSPPINELGAASEATPSSPSSLTDPPPRLTGEEILAALVADLQNGPLTIEQSRCFNSIHGMLSLTRESLLTTTGMVADEVTNCMDTLSEAVVAASHKLESALEDNLRILCATGATDVQLAELSTSIRSSARQPVLPVTLHPVRAGPLAQPTDMVEQQPHIERALPPQRAKEPHDAFERRAKAALNQRENAASTFQSTQPMSMTGHGFHRQEPQHMAKHMRFDTMEGASTAGNRRMMATPMGTNQSPSGYTTQQPSTVGQATVPYNKSVPALTRAAAITPSRNPIPMSGMSRPPVTNTTKTCFSCGTSASRAPRPALCAGRVESSYSVDEYADTADQGDGNGPSEEELEGTWGSMQYEAEELLDHYNYPADHDDQPADAADPNEAPDLDALLHDKESPEILVGAMRPIRRYFSMRVNPIEDTPAGNAPPALTDETTLPTGMRHLMLDTDVVILGTQDESNSLWTTNDEHRGLAERVGWDTGLVSHEQLLSAFYDQHGSSMTSRPAAMELDVIEAIGAEANAHVVWNGIIQSQPLMIVGFSPTYLRSTAVDVEAELPRFEQMFSELQPTIADIRVLQWQRQLACTGLHEQSVSAGESNSRAPQLITRALTMNCYLIHDITLSIHMLEHRLTRIGHTRRALEEEGTRRSLEREEFNSLLAIFLTRESTARPTPSSPPSYPGSPHGSDDYYPADEAPLLSRVHRSHTVSKTAVSTTSSLSNSELNHSASDNGHGAVHNVDEVTTVPAHVATPNPTGDEIVLWVEHSALPQYHLLNPDFQDEHRCAMDTAVTELAVERHRPRVFADHWVDWASAPKENDDGVIVLEINGFPDHMDGIFRGRGLVYHEGLASTGPNRDNKNAWPGFRAQILAQRVEHMATVRRPRSLPPTAAPESMGLMDQPTRSSKTIACLTALIKIGGVEAYALFDSGSNKDSMTGICPWHWRRLGCVGSQSKISYGTRVPVEFGGIRGHVYFDQVNLDRYDVVIGTPFMNKHGIILDFGTMEIRFPRGHSINTLSSLEEALLVETRSKGNSRWLVPK
ncbi:hypothetical protein K438DRAFT_1783871 [Mycena galopus ATCC 62051]|nr:hypothetical protein K438DRAFT_1783871 [Mycena galopus ATCC 62051]